MFDIDSPFTMVVAIVAIAVFGGVLSTHLKTRNERENSPEQDRELDEMRKEISRLRDRVHTLEKLATDPEEKLKREFERL
jgi:phage shock protein B